MKFRTVYAILSTSGILLNDLDADWVQETREWAQLKIEDLMMQTANCYLTKGMQDNAEVLLNKLVDVNPFSEIGYHRLLDIYAGQIRRKNSFIAMINM